MSTNKPSSDAVSGDPAFERWLARQLHKMYDDVLREEVPEELLRVIDRAAGPATVAETGSVNGSSAGKPPAAPRSAAGTAGVERPIERIRAKRDHR